MTKFFKSQDAYETASKAVREQIRVLDEEYKVALNLACSSWDDTIIGFIPVSIEKNMTNLLIQNYETLRQELSYRRFLIVKAFKLLDKNITFHEDDYASYKWWVRRKPPVQKRTKI